MEVGGVEKIVRANVADGQSFVHRAGSRIVLAEDGSSGKGGRRRITRTRRRGNTRVPAKNRAGFGGKNEEAFAGITSACHNEVRRTIKDCTGRPPWNAD